MLFPAVAAMQSRWSLLVTSDIAQRLPVADGESAFHRRGEEGRKKEEKKEVVSFIAKLSNLGK